MKSGLTPSRLRGQNFIASELEQLCYSSQCRIEDSVENARVLRVGSIPAIYSHPLRSVGIRICEASPIKYSGVSNNGSALRLTSSQSSWCLEIILGLFRASHISLGPLLISMIVYQCSHIYYYNLCIPS